MAQASTTRTICTVGHSTRSLQEFLAVLAGANIALVADVRRFPGSRRQPHFNQEALASSLAAAGIEYRHFVDLGGRRSERLPDSPNNAWRVESFNAYADYMQAASFLAALNQLERAAEAKSTAFMCSEALPQKCHRRLIADALLVRAWQVRHLLSATRMQDHTLTPFVHVQEISVTYPAATLF